MRNADDSIAESLRCTCGFCFSSARKTMGARKDHHDVVAGRGERVPRKIRK
jgi:hypothetical protein